MFLALIDVGGASYYLRYILSSACLIAQISVQFLAGDPDAIAKFPGREEIKSLNEWTNSENLQLLNLRQV